MKTQTAQTRLAKLSLTKNTRAYQFVTEIINGAKTIRPCYTSGRGRFTSNQDHTRATCEILDKMNVKYTLTNDAPRSSATGNVITVKTKFEV